MTNQEKIDYLNLEYTPDSLYLPSDSNIIKIALFYRKAINQVQIILDELIMNLNHLNIKETYIIGVILGFITLILWCLLRRKKRILEQKQLAEVSVSTTNSDVSTSSKQLKHGKNKKIGSNDDGYLSDSALSFFKLNNGPRFRKRDKLAFYGKKMLRTVSHVRGPLSALRGSQEKTKNIYKMLSKKILNLKNEDSNEPQYRRTELPEFLLDIESTNEKNDHDLPAVLVNLFRSVKVFGYFDQKIILEMCKYMETRTVYANNYLFKIGEPDDSIYVVQSGKINVYITDEKGRKHLIKECTEGNHIFSLLSIMDVLTGDLKPYKTVSAKAAEDTTVLRLPGKAFVEVLHKYPDYLVRITQIIIVRLQRVTFTALHNYLGLTSEIVRSSYSKKKKIRNSESMEISNKVGLSEAHKLAEGKKNRRHHHHHHHHHHHYHPRDQFKLNNSLDKDTSEANKNEESGTDFSIRKGHHSLPAVGFFADDSDKTQKRNVSSSSESVASDSSSDETNSGSEFGDDSITQDMNRKLPTVKAEIADLLKLNEKNILDNKISLVRISEGTVLCKEGDFNCGLIYVIDGLLYATQKELNGEESSVFYCNPKQFCANMSVISGEPSLFGIKAKFDSEIAIISKENFHKLITAQPTVILSVAHLIVKRMSPFVRQLDFALEWNLIESGSALFRQGVRAENISIVLNGRLRSILKVDVKSEKRKQLVGEFGRGDLVGLVEILMETNNATTVVAIRDTEVAQIPSGLLNYIKYRHPRVVTRLIQMLSSKILGTIQNTPTTPYIDSSIRLNQPIEAPTIASNLCTVAILPVTNDVPLHAFTMQLCHALNAIDNSLLLTKDLIIQKLGQHALERVNEYRLCAWLGQQEDHHRIVLYQCESELTPWTRRCMRQADCLLIVGLASKEPTVGQLEKEIENFAIRAQKELILLHDMNGSRPTNTVKWLSMRNWCSSHHHIRCPDKLLKTGNNEKLKKQFEADLIKEKVDKMTDFSRLARFLTGTSIGLVLGGGGARGCAHVGMIKAMKEANIPIDMVGGTSIGSFMGALWAEENEYERFCERAKEWSYKMKSYRKQIFDLTYPVTSMFKGRAFNSLIEEVFGNRQIEDLWIPYFCVTTDISSSKMRIHMNGTIWKFVRASMTYCGILPPLCDPFDGHLLVDGCYTNNLPADVMHRMGVNTVLAVDVGSKDDDIFTNYGDELSGWWLLWKKWNRWSSPVKVPDLTEIQSRLAYVSCERGLEMVKNSDYCEYMRPPIDKYRTLQFSSFDEIKDVGYNYGKILFDTWLKHDGSIEKFLYRKSQKNNNSNFATKNKQESPINDKVYSRLASKNNKYRFEDLSQFVQTSVGDSVKKVSSQNKLIADALTDESVRKLKKIMNSDNNDLFVLRKTRSLTRIYEEGDDSEEFQNYSNIEDYDQEDLNDSFSLRLQNLNKKRQNEEIKNASIENTEISTSSPTYISTKRNSISGTTNTLLETAKLANLIKTSLSHENSENEMFKNKIDKNLINLAKLSVNADENLAN
ncbi:unnamed protein product [Brachionus calyciflorus]|uniref:lysophospholipase n=1 Tax=Brachionus calyciflorus TaxID=104777 RepID=A0A813RJU6_9BILA|nr:unnamed protein product [Brachionus calyciflorus]